MGQFSGTWQGVDVTVFGRLPLFLLSILDFKENCNWNSTNLYIHSCWCNCRPRCVTKVGIINFTWPTHCTHMYREIELLTLIFPPLIVNGDTPALPYPVLPCVGGYTGAILGVARESHKIAALPTAPVSRNTANPSDVTNAPSVVMLQVKDVLADFIQHQRDIRNQLVVRLKEIRSRFESSQFFQTHEVRTPFPKFTQLLTWPKLFMSQHVRRFTSSWAHD